MKITKIVALGLALLWLASCGKDSGSGVSAAAIQGFWKDGARARAFYVFGANRVLWDSSFDKRSPLNFVVIADYRIDGTTLVRGSFIRTMPMEYKVRNFSEGSFSLEGGSSTLNLVRMTTAEVEAAFGNAYLNQPERLVSDLAARTFRSSSTTISAVGE